MRGCVGVKPTLKEPYPSTGMMHRLEGASEAHRLERSSSPLFGGRQIGSRCQCGVAMESGRVQGKTCVRDSLLALIVLSRSFGLSCFVQCGTSAQFCTTRWTHQET